MASSIGQLNLDIMLRFKMSFWDALKLRIAGPNAGPIVDVMVEKIKEELKKMDTKE